MGISSELQQLAEGRKRETKGFLGMKETVKAVLRVKIMAICACIKNQESVSDLSIYPKGLGKHKQIKPQISRRKKIKIRGKLIKLELKKTKRRSINKKFLKLITKLLNHWPN